MKAILTDPILLPFILVCGVIYLLLCFQLVSKNKKISAAVEKIFIGLYLFTMPGPGIEPFPKIIPNALADREKTFASLIVQIALYAAIFFILSPRLQQTFKGSLEVLALVLQKNPGFCIFLFLLSLSFAWSDTPVETLKYSMVWLGTTLVSSYIVKQYSYQEIATILRWVLAITAVLSAYYSKFKPSIGINLTKNSWQGIFSHPNSFASIMAVGAILWLIEAVDNPKKRWLSIGLGLFSLYTMQMAQSGGARVQFILALMLVASIRFLKQLPFQWAFFFIVIFLVISISGSIVVADNLEAIVVGGLGKDLTLTGRTPLWEYLFEEKIPKRPVLGYGFHGFWQPWRKAENPAANTLDGRLEMPSGEGFWSPPHAHNGFIEIIIAFGFVGFFFFAISFVTALADAVRYLTRPQPPGTGIIESALPLILLFFVVFPNLTEIPLVENNQNWYYYVFTTVGVCIKNSGRNLRVDPGGKKAALRPGVP